MTTTITKRKYMKTAKEFVEAVQWNGKNYDEVKRLVPENLLEFITDRVTQITNVKVTNLKQRKTYFSNLSDYVVKLDEDSFIIVDRFEFEKTYTDYEIISKEEEDKNEEMYFKIDVVKATKVEGGYNVKDHTGFVKFVEDTDFEKQYRAVNPFFGRT